MRGFLPSLCSPVSPLILETSTSLTELLFPIAVSTIIDMDAPAHFPPDGNQNRTGPIIGMMIGALTLSCIIVGLRMYTRYFILKSVHWDDWTMVLALVLHGLR